MKALLQALFIGLMVFLGIFLMSNLDKGVSNTSMELLHVQMRGDLAYDSLIRKYPALSLTIEDTEKKLIRVPYGETTQVAATLRKDSLVQMVTPVPQPVSISFQKYFYELGKQLKQYTQGELGNLTYNSRIDTSYPINPQLPDMLTRSLSYLVPGLLLGIVVGYLLALYAALKPKIGAVLDNLHAVLMAIPDFFLITVLQLIAIAVAKLAGKKVFTIMQFGSDVPILIPLLSISILPAALLFGAMRIAVVREWEEGYIKTAFSKGLSHSMVVIRHILRNTLPDLLTILPKVIAVGITSLVVAEVMCGIFGLGGYAIHQNLVKVTSLPATCAILACLAIVSNGVIALIRKRFVVQTKEGA